MDICVNPKFQERPWKSRAHSRERNIPHYTTLYNRCLHGYNGDQRPTPLPFCLSIYPPYSSLPVWSSSVEQACPLHHQVTHLRTMGPRSPRTSMPPAPCRHEGRPSSSHHLRNTCESPLPNHTQCKYITITCSLREHPSIFF